MLVDEFRMNLPLGVDPVDDKHCNKATWSEKQQATTLQSFN
jgi:hypothetical protein